MLNITEQLKQTLLQCALRNSPFEACGVVVENNETKELSFIQVTNVHPNKRDNFSMDMREVDLIDTRADVTVVGYAHSHPNGTSMPSSFDRVQCNLHNKPYIIVGTVDRDVSVLMPATVPLIGREFVHGVQDCFTLVRDYYIRELGINVPDFSRDDLWWTHSNSSSMYEDNFASAGFVRVQKSDMSQLRRHDVLIAYVGHTHFPNHAMIYLGSDGSLKSEASADVVGSRMYLHHLHNNASCRTLLGESKFTDVALVLRHESLL